MEKSKVIRALGALSHPVRLDIFRALVVQGQTGLTPGAIVEGLDIPSATLSFHLKELANAGLVTQERVSRHLVYRAAYARMNELLAYLTANCCQGEACLPQAAATCAC